MYNIFKDINSKILKDLMENLYKTKNQYFRY